MNSKFKEPRPYQPRMTGQMDPERYKLPLHAISMVEEFWFISADADRSDPIDQYTEGRICLDGVHPNEPKDADIAGRWFRLSAAQGNRMAQHALGKCYESSTGVPGVERIAKAKFWYRLAAERGCADSQFSLGMMRYVKDDPQDDIIETVGWFRLSAEQDHPQAQHMLGRCYRDGYGIEQDFSRAIRWFELAATKGLADAQADLGYCYDCGIGVSRDGKKAVELYQLAAKQRNSQARNLLGLHYLLGEYLPKDERHAAYLFRIASQRSFYMAAHINLGICCLLGLGLEKDAKRAVRRIKLGAVWDIGEAQLLLAHCYATGTGIAQNDDQAEHWRARSQESDFDTLDLIPCVPNAMR